MEHYRERVVRGTPDCPFARYHISTKQPSPVFRHIHWHPEMEILYMRKGCAEVRTGKHIFTFHPGEIVFIHPNELHDIRSLDAFSEHDAFVFSLDLVTLPESHFFQSSVIQPLRSDLLRFPQSIAPHDCRYTRVTEALDSICQTPKDAPEYKMVVFSGILRIFIAMSDALTCAGSEADTRNETVKMCIRYIDSHFASPITLSEIASQVHLHPNYLCHLFRSYTGQTMFEYLNRLRIEKAAQLLRAADLSVSDAAAQCGFESVSFFSRKFKSIMGITPKQYAMRF